MSKQLMTTLNLKRPAWESVSNAYIEINEIGKAEYYSAIEKAIQEGASDNVAYHRAELAQAQKRYEKVGGQALREFNRDSKSYINTCALRVSYALNHGGMPLIENRVKLTSGTKLIGKDNYKYYTGVSSIKGLLLENWKQLKPYSQANGRDFYKIFYDYRKEPFKTLADIYGNIFNPTRVAEIRRNNKNFFNALCSLKIKGIVTMVIEGWGNAGGHTTLWNGKGFLDETNYLDYYKEAIFVRELCFWELL
ncbi:conserved hypothetical protein [Helicobacter cinaedi CCUG 18818 = ATCC BAA-847]|uniref:Type VI secretion system (T6SS), amidase effector protein 4 n=1 Tax=Helicobacter cinaedi CCUG 18818 = ATCC BAA-847 TaxID=537971 RepID=A0AAI8QHG7_9HELI|nr:type VI secretion system amidase effector protein Tae4 [Helicobacter cinaedi]BAM32790.1 conserved hypothetical protein [Helicobacter cinaedi CCUG 18818 = ATCC BAA-847]